MKRQVKTRSFEAKDVSTLLDMMKALAHFEGYLDDFNVTEETLRTKGLCSEPTFSAIVAENEAELIGYGVYYTIPFTYDLHPTIILKELYVTAEARGTGAGQAIFDHIRRTAKVAGAKRLQWLVLPSNHSAKAFYRKQGGQPDLAWERWHMAP